MKKLKLKLDGVKDILTKEQMKKISGGYGEDPCPGFDKCYCYDPNTQAWFYYGCSSNCHLACEWAWG